MTRCKHEWKPIVTTSLHWRTVYRRQFWCEKCGGWKTTWREYSGELYMHPRYRYPRTLKKKGQDNG